jgi:hypothetical protein
MNLSSLLGSCAGGAGFAFGVGFGSAYGWNDEKAPQAEP